MAGAVHRGCNTVYNKYSILIRNKYKKLPFLYPYNGPLPADFLVYLTKKVGLEA
jgi:hypothetical protein